MSLSQKEQAPTAEHSRWFTEEVHPHNGHLKAYLRGAFPSVRDLDDVIQESYLRIWRARLSRPIRSSKAFLFQVARHLAIDVIRSRRTAPVEIDADFDGLPVLDNRPDAAADLSRRERIELVSEALASLPDRTREIIFMHKFSFMPQKAVAAQLGISERTVEAHVAKGMKKCEIYLRRRGILGFPQDD